MRNPFRRKKMPDQAARAVGLLGTLTIEERAEYEGLLWGMVLGSVTTASQERIDELDAAMEQRYENQERESWD